MTNILVTEDNDGLRRLLCIHLRRAGYEVYEARDGAEALRVLERVNIHLIVADLMMPGMDGWELLDELRGAGMNMPVLIVTARDSLEDKRRGFRTGADDYMTKPLDFEELLLRIEALLRRCNINLRSTLTVGGCTLHSDTLQVVHGAETVQLRQKEYLLLEKLLSYPLRIFTRQALMDDIWGYDSESDPRTVDTHIRRLREKLEGIADFEIQTVRGLGYRAVLHVGESGR